MVGKILDKRFVVLEVLGPDDGEGVHCAAYDMSGMSRVYLRVLPDDNGQLSGNKFIVLGENTPAALAFQNMAKNAVTSSSPDSGHDHIPHPTGSITPKISNSSPSSITDKSSQTSQNRELEAPQTAQHTVTPSSPASNSTAINHHPPLEQSLSAKPAADRSPPSSPSNKINTNQAVPQRSVIDPLAIDPSDMTQPLDLASAEELQIPNKTPDAAVSSRPSAPVEPRKRIQTKVLEAAWFAQGDQFEDAEPPVLTETHPFHKIEQQNVLERQAVELSMDDYRKYALEISPPLPPPPVNIMETFLEAKPEVMLHAVIPNTFQAKEKSTVLPYQGHAPEHSQSKLTEQKYLSDNPSAQKPQASPVKAEVILTAQDVQHSTSHESSEEKNTPETVSTAINKEKNAPATPMTTSEEPSKQPFLTDKAHHDKSLGTGELSLSPPDSKTASTTPSPNPLDIKGPVPTLDPSARQSLPSNALHQSSSPSVNLRPAPSFVSSMPPVPADAVQEAALPQTMVSDSRTHSKTELGSMQMHRVEVPSASFIPAAHIPRSFSISHFLQKKLLGHRLGTFVLGAGIGILFSLLIGLFSAPHPKVAVSSATANQESTVRNTSPNIVPNAQIPSPSPTPSIPSLSPPPRPGKSSSSKSQASVVKSKERAIGTALVEEAMEVQKTSPVISERQKIQNHLILARKAMKAHQWKKAQQLVTHVLRIQPGNKQAKKLAIAIKAKKNI